MNGKNDVYWRIHLTSSPEDVFQFLSTDLGRARFWAESTEEVDGLVVFIFPNGVTYQAEILRCDPPHHFQLQYYGGTVATFELSNDGAGGTELLLGDVGVLPENRDQVLAGWVSVLLALKAAADFGIDLRNHDPSRTWDQGYADN